MTLQERAFEIFNACPGATYGWHDKMVFPTNAWSRICTSPSDTGPTSININIRFNLTGRKEAFDYLFAQADLNITKLEFSEGQCFADCMLRKGE